MTRESILSMLVTCQHCSKTYLPENDVCNCHEEPVVREWESHPFQPSAIHWDGECRRVNHEARKQHDAHAAHIERDHP